MAYKKKAAKKSGGRKSAKGGRGKAAAKSRVGRMAAKKPGRRKVKAPVRPGRRP